jgi:hypothetical protein
MRKLIQLFIAVSRFARIDIPTHRVRLYSSRLVCMQRSERDMSSALAAFCAP